MVARFQVRLHAFVLMDNHYHLMIELTEANLSRAMQWLNVSYSVWFNRRYTRSGHLFQGRFKSVVVDPTEWGLSLSRYVHLNPVRVGQLGLGKTDREAMRVGASGAPADRVVKERLSRLRRYRWSSYRAYVGLSQAPGWLECDGVWGLSGGKRTEQRQRYRDYVEEAVREGLGKSPWEQLKEQVVLGGEEFLETLRRQVKGDPWEQRAARRLASARPGLEQVIRCLEKLKGEQWTEFRDRHGDSGRDLVLYLGRRVCGLPLKELATAAGVGDYAAVGMAVARFEKRLRQHTRDGEQVKRVCHLLNVEM